jgi:hypothetical protein
MNDILFLSRYGARVASRSRIYGAEWTKVASPAMTRTGSAVGMTAAAGIGSQAVTNSFDSAYPWNAIRPETDSLGNTFMRIPKFYIRKTDEANLYRIEVSGVQHVGFYLPACFYDFTNSRELPYVDFGKHLGSLDGTKLASKPNVFPLNTKSIVQFRDYARANNAGGLLGYQQLDVHAHDVLSALFTVEFATLNSQAIMPGYTTGSYSATHVATAAETGANRLVLATAFADTFRVGGSIGIGTSLGGQQVAINRTITAIDVVDASNKAISFDGAAVNIALGNIIYSTAWKAGFSSGIAAPSGCITANDGKYPCAYRGIESPWGDIWQFVDGVNINERQAWVAANAADYASNLFAAPYVQLGYANGSTDNYTTALGYDAASPFAQFPTVNTGGGATTYYSDYYYSTTGQRIARVGGNWYLGSAAGLRYWHLGGASSDAGVLIGGRLIRKPL